MSVLISGWNWELSQQIKLPWKIWWMQVWTIRAIQQNDKRTRKYWPSWSMCLTCKWAPCMLRWIPQMSFAHQHQDWDSKISNRSPFDLFICQNLMISSFSPGIRGVIDFVSWDCKQEYEVKNHYVAHLYYNSSQILWHRQHEPLRLPLYNIDPIAMNIDTR